MNADSRVSVCKAFAMPAHPERRRVFVSYAHADAYKADLIERLMVDPRTIPMSKAILDGYNGFNDEWRKLELEGVVPRAKEPKRFDPVAFSVEATSAAFGLDVGYLYGGGKVGGLVGFGVGWWTGNRLAKRIDSGDLG
jgi:hypothetical protein